MHFHMNAHQSITCARNLFRRSLLQASYYKSNADVYRDLQVKNQCKKTNLFPTHLFPMQNDQWHCSIRDVLTVIWHVIPSLTSKTNNQHNKERSEVKRTIKYQSIDEGINFRNDVFSRENAKHLLSSRTLTSDFFECTTKRGYPHSLSLS